MTQPACSPNGDPFTYISKHRYRNVHHLTFTITDFHPGLLIIQAEAESSATERSRNRGSDTARSVHTVRHTSQTPPQNSRLNTLSSDLYKPQMNEDGTPGNNTERYGPASSDIGIAWGSPSRDVIPPAISQAPSFVRSAEGQFTPPIANPGGISPAIQAAIDRAVEVAVNKAMRLIQEDTIKIMQDFTNKRAMMENEKAGDFKKWFDDRLTRMENRIQRSEGIVNDAGHSQDRENLGDGVRYGGKDASAPGGAETSSDGAVEASAPVQGSLMAPDRGISESLSGKLVSYDIVIWFALGLTSFTDKKSVYVLQKTLAEDH